MSATLTRGQAGRSAFPSDYRGYSGWRTPLEREWIDSPMSEEEYAVHLNGVNSRKLRELRTQANISNARKLQNFLMSVSPGDLDMVFNKPEEGDERQKMLQAALNNDYKGREIGMVESFRGNERNRREAIRLLPLQLQLQRERRMEEQSRFNQGLSANRFNLSLDTEMARREARDRQFGANEEYRDERLARTDQSFANRVQNQDRNFNFRQDQAGIRNDRADANMTRNLFGDWVRAANSGVPVGQLDEALASMWETLTPAQQQMAMGYIGQRTNANNQAQQIADRYQAEFKRLEREAAATAESPAQATAIAANTVANMIRRDPNARTTLTYDVQSQSFMPTSRFRGSGPVNFAPAGGGGFAGAASAGSSSTPSAPRSVPQDGLYMRNDGVPVRIINGQEFPLTNFRPRQR